MGLAILTAAVLAGSQAFAQGEQVPAADPETPFTQTYNAQYGYRGTALRLSYESPTYGMHDDQFSLGLQNRRPAGDGVYMLDAMYYLNLEHSQIMGLNAGLGRRWLYQSSFSETGRIFGASFWYDGVNTELDNMFNQVGFSLESLGEMWDFRLNTNFIAGSTRQEGTGIPTGEIYYSEYYLTQQTLIPIDQAVSNVDFEVARRIGEDNIWVYGGGYSIWEDDTDDSCFGGKAGVRGYVYDDLLLQLGVSSDDMFDTKVTFSLIWYPGRSNRKERARHTIDDRLMEPVIRNNYIALKRDETTGGTPVEYEDGELVRVVHVDSNASAPGDGTFENPFTSLTSVYGGSQDRDIILVHADSAFTDQLTQLRDNQRFLGEGNNIMHEVTVKTLGTIDLPETSPGAYAGATPTITNVIAGDVVTLGAAATSRDWDDDSAYSTNEVNNFVINGGTRGIVSAAGVGIGEATIKNINLSNTTGNGIELTEYVQTIEEKDGSDTKQILFSPTIDTVTLTDIGGDGINLNATSTEPASTSVTESIKIANVTSTNGTGQGISITNNKSLASISNFEQDGGTTAAGGILFTNSKGGASISEVSITGGAAGVGTGTGISIVEDGGISGESSGTFTIAETTITDTAGAAFHMDGGSAGGSFTGLISQTKNAPAVFIEGEHTGSVSFNESEDGDGVISATAGTGLVFNQADGTYTFNDGVELIGVSTGISATDSDGTITLKDALIQNATTTAVLIDGGAAKLAYTGQVVQTTAAVAAINVIGDHTGTVTFTQGATSSSETGNGVIVASTGPGLIFGDAVNDGADGTYTFNSAITLSGTAVVDIQSSEEGTFTFPTGSSIANTAGTAFTIADSEAVNVTYGGTIDSTGGRPVEITGNSGDSLAMFTGKITSSANGIFIDDNSGGTYQFSGQVDLDTTTNTAVDLGSLNGNTGSTVSFSNLQINTTTGTGFNATGGGTIQLTGSNNTVETTTGTGVNINGMIIAASGANFKSVSVVGATNGILLNDVTGTGTFSVGASGSNFGDGGTIQNTTGAGISITNAARVSLNHMTIDNSTGDGITFTQDDISTSTVSINNNQIINVDGVGINLIVEGNAVTSNITANDNVVSTENHEALLLSVNDSGTKTINIEVNDNTMSNDSTLSTISLQADGKVALNATVEGNVLTNNSTTTGRVFEAEANYSSANVQLSLLNNNAWTLGAGNSATPFLLNKVAGTFKVVSLGGPGTVSALNTSNGGTGDYDDYNAPNVTPAAADWVIEFLPDAAPLTPPLNLGFGNLNEGDVPTPQ